MWRIATLILVAGFAHAETMGEAQTVTWEEIDGLRLSSVGYRSTDDPCRIAGETELTIDFLDDSADLVACPVDYVGQADFLATYPSREVGRTTNFVLFSVSRR